ncbi:adenylosuccinate synthetase [Nakamurella sp.]|uniref:adenylosuccinate synthetase n=1 Tax=Nakamurella sp. TaxID=1869182 RepID=UPI003785165B
MTGPIGGSDGGTIIVVGLGFGDEAKGATVDFLCSQGDVAGVVRFNGGAQAAHNVIADGRHHTFRQFGSGTLCGVPTFLSRHCLVEPIGLAGEAEELAALGVPDPLSLLTVDPDALLTTPVHVAANRTREDRRGTGRHGSTGLGIGETVWYDLAVRRGARAGERVENLMAPADTRGRPLRVRDCLDPRSLRRRLDELVRFYAPLLAGSDHGHDDVEAMADLLEAFAGAVRIAAPGHLARTARRGRLVFEGAQGVLLDEWRGFHPHTTWSTTTPANAQRLLAEAGLPRGDVLGLTRTYTTRHGAGPLPTEDPALLAVDEPHNGPGRYQGGWRAGHLDLVALSYAVEAVGGVDALAVSHLDVVDDSALPAIHAVGAYRTAAGFTDRLPVGPPQDLAHQAALTGLLGGATGRGRVLTGSRDAVLTLERALNAPVQVLAFGPDRADRKLA